MYQVPKQISNLGGTNQQPANLFTKMVPLCKTLKENFLIGSNPCRHIFNKIFASQSIEPIHQISMRVMYKTITVNALTKKFFPNSPAIDVEINP